MTTNQIKENFGAGGANLTPGKSAGQPSLAEVIRGLADDAVRLSALHTTEVVPLDAQAGRMMKRVGFILDAHGPANEPLVYVPDTPGVGEFTYSAGVITTGDAIASITVRFVEHPEQAAILYGATEPHALSDGETLELLFDREYPETITFNTGDFVDIANATTAEVVAVINAVLHVDWWGDSWDRNGDLVVQSGSYGLDSFALVTGGTAAALGLPAAEDQGEGLYTKKA